MGRGPDKWEVWWKSGTGGAGPGADGRAWWRGGAWDRWAALAEPRGGARRKGGTSRPASRLPCGPEHGRQVALRRFLSLAGQVLNMMCPRAQIP